MTNGTAALCTDKGVYQPHTGNERISYNNFICD